MRKFPVSPEVKSAALATAEVIQQHLEQFESFPPTEEREHFLNNTFRPSLLESIGFVYDVARMGLESFSAAGNQALAQILPDETERESVVSKLPPVVELAEHFDRIRQQILNREYTSGVARTALSILNGASDGWS